MRIKKTSQYIEGGAGLPSYFTDEIDTGMKWIDGKPIYRKVIQTTMPTYTSGSPVYKYIKLDGIDNIVNLNGYIYQIDSSLSNNYAIWTLPYIRIETSPYLEVLLYYKMDFYTEEEGKNSITIKSNVPWLSNEDVIIIAEYTKTTD